MDRSIDLDAAAGTARSVLDASDIPGVQVDELTWLDAGSAWPRSFATDRRMVIEPVSLGIRARKGEQEGTLVLYRGGWADLSYVDVGKEFGLEETIGWEEPLRVEAYRDLLYRFLALFR